MSSFITSLGILTRANSITSFTKKSLFVGSCVLYASYAWANVVSLPHEVQPSEPLQTMQTVNIQHKQTITRTQTPTLKHVSNAPTDNQIDKVIDEPNKTSNPLSPSLPSDHYRTDNDDSWVDSGRTGIKRWLNQRAGNIDDWFGTPNPNEPASANLRFLVDINHNRYDGATIKPRVRGRLSLPTLERRLSVLIGDDGLDNERYNTGQQANTAGLGDETKRFDRTQVKDDNASLALRWSKLTAALGLETDADIGIRSGDDIYLRLRAERHWQHTDDISTKFEQIYRYGTDSEHYLRSNLHTAKDFGNRKLINHSYLDYTHQDTEVLLYWGNSLYQHHRFDGRLGDKTLNYGVYMGGEIADKKASLDSYGPFVNYRQPVWRRWLFVQGEMSFYNQKPLERSHHLGVFMRFEAIF